MEWDPDEIVLRRSCRFNICNCSTPYAPSFPRSLNLDIYQWVNQILLMLMIPPDEENNKFLYETIESNVTTSPSYFFLKEDLIENDNQGLYGLVQTFSIYFRFFSIFLVLTLAIRLTLKAFGFNLPTLKDTKPRLFLRTGVYILLFALLLIEVIYVSYLLKDMESTEKTILDYKDYVSASENSSFLGILSSESRIYREGLSPSCPYDRTNFTREDIDSKFDHLREEILNDCLTNSKEAEHDFDGYKQFLQEKLEELKPFMEDLKYMKDTAEVHSVESEESAELYGMFDDLKKALEELKKPVDSLKLTDFDWSKKVSSEYQKTDQLLRKAFEKSNSEAKRLLEVAELYTNSFGNITLRVSLWMEKLADFSTRLVKNGIFDIQEISFPRINQGTLTLPIAIGMVFLLLAYFGTFCKLLAVTERPQFKRANIWAGRIYYVGFIYFVLTSCFFSLMFLRLSENAIPARSICAAVGDQDNFETAWKRNFYSQDVFEKIYKPVKSSLIRAGEGVKNYVTMGEVLNFPEVNEIFSMGNVLNTWALRTYLARTRIEAETILRNVNHHDDEDISGIMTKNIQNAVDALKLTGEKDGFLANTLKQKNSPAFVLFLAEEIKFFVDELNGHTWIPERKKVELPKNGKIVETINQAIRAPGCKLLNPDKFEDLFFDINAKIKTLADYITDQYSPSDISAMLNDNNEMLCRITSEPLSTLFFFCVVNTILWVVSTIVILRTATSWSQSEQKINLLESLTSPLIEEEKEGGAIYENPLVISDI